MAVGVEFDGGHLLTAYSPFAERHICATLHLMPLHHYLPATYLASFSKDLSLPRRDRVIAIGDKRSKRVFSAPAARVGAIRDFYTLVSAPKDDPQLLEKIWAQYETDLADAVERLVSRSPDALTWAHVLVPFITGLLVRGPDFNERFEARIKPWRHLAGPDNTNLARLMEVQRLLGPIAAAKWIVMEARGEGSLMTNDVGFAAFVNPDGRWGLAIPLGRGHVLGLIPRRRGPVAVARDGKWRPIIEYVDLRPDNHRHLNITLAEGAHRFIFGPDELTVTRYLGHGRDSPSRVPEPYDLGFISGPLAMVHEFTWHRLVGVLAKPPDHEDAWKFDLDWKAIASGWKPVAIIPSWGPRVMFDLPPALRREGDVIYVDFYDVEGLTTPPTDESREAR